MIFTKALSYKEITKTLDKETDIIAMVGCETCVRVAGVGGVDKLRNLALQLREDGYHVLEGHLIPEACTPKIFFAKIDPKVTTLISLSCNAGTTNFARNYSHLKVIETVEDIGLMVSDTDQEILKITMPYKKNSTQRGQEYHAGDGKKLDTNNNLPIMEVKK